MLIVNVIRTHSLDPLWSVSPSDVSGDLLFLVAVIGLAALYLNEQNKEHLAAVEHGLSSRPKTRVSRLLLIGAILVCIAIAAISVIE